MVGDDIVPDAVVVMDRGFTVPGPPEEVFRWLVQLGKQRAGWYLPRGLERLLPPSRRAVRRIDQRWQTLAVGDRIPDYGGRNETFMVAAIRSGDHVVYQSQRGGASVSWAIGLTAVESSTATRVRLRLRAGPLKHRWLVASAGELLDLLTVAGMAAGLRERLVESHEE